MDSARDVEGSDSKPGKSLEENFLKFSIDNFEKALKSGHINGDILIDLSVGSLAHLYRASDYFKQIIVLKTKDQIMEPEELVEPGVFDDAAEIEADSFSDRLQEEKVRSALRNIVKFDLDNKENMTDPIEVPPADCIFSAWLLDVISKDQDDYMTKLRKFSGLLKPGGHFILIGGINATFLSVGKDKFHVLKHDMDFVRNALVSEGFLIDKFEVKMRRNASDLTDSEAVIFIVAHKEE